MGNAHNFISDSPRKEPLCDPNDDCDIKSLLHQIYTTTYTFTVHVKRASRNRLYAHISCHLCRYCYAPIPTSLPMALLIASTDICLRRKKTTVSDLCTNQSEMILAIFTFLVPTIGCVVPCSVSKTEHPEYRYTTYLSSPIAHSAALDATGPTSCVPSATDGTHADSQSAAFQNRPGLAFPPENDQSLLAQEKDIQNDRNSMNDNHTPVCKRTIF